MSGSSDCALGEERENIEDVGCLGIATDERVSENISVNDDVVNITPLSDINIIHKHKHNISLTEETSDTRNCETEIFNNGKRYIVPEGLEIIPIYKETSVTIKNTQSSNILESLLLQGDCARKTALTDTYKVIREKFNLGSCFDFDTTNKIKDEDNCEEFSDRIGRVAVNLETGKLNEFKFNVKPDFPHMVWNGNMDLNSFLSQHILLAAFGLIGNEEISQTNLEMLIGQKSGGGHYCKLCGIEATDKLSVGNHINNKHSSRKNFELTIKCPFCPYKNVNRYKLTNHVTSHTMLKPFQCPTCNYGTTTKAMLRKHMFTHSEDKPFKCSECSYTSNEKYKVKVHSLNQHSAGMKPYRCVSCNFSSADKSTLRRHLMKHSDVRLYKCDTCPYTGNSIHDLRKHETSHTNVKPFSCPMCSFTCNFNSNMQKHIKTHTGERKYKCADCNFSSMSRSKLLKHALRHTGKLPYQCDQCPYGTTELPNFKSHMNNHNNIREFKCQFCEYAGTCNINLKRHMLVHSTEKPFKCTRCDYATKEKSKLKRHMKIHKEALPNKCPYCDFENYHNSNFKRHVLSHKDSPEFTCAECDSVCFSRSKLIKHLKTHLIECDDTTGDESEEGNSLESNQYTKASS